MVGRMDDRGTYKGRTEHGQVTARGPLSTCNVVRWENAADGLTMFVECRNGAGRVVDSRYNVLVIELLCMTPCRTVFGFRSMGSGIATEGLIDAHAMQPCASKVAGTLVCPITLWATATRLAEQ